MPELTQSSEDYVSPEQGFPELVETPHTICVPVPTSFVNAISATNQNFISEDAENLLSGFTFVSSFNSQDRTDFILEGSFLGRYRIGPPLGQGGFGTVYLAEDEELNRTVAIKVQHADRLESRDEGKERYLKEARLLAGLDHTHIVPIYDVGKTEKGTPYIVSKFIPGCTLAERIRRSRLSIVESAELIARMAEALAYAHDHQVVHRDIKPGNIALENGEKPYLIDFGLAERESDLELESGVFGTPAYMSPEQAKGENHLVDGRSDIYSLGVVFYELLVAVLPHEGEGVIQLLLNISKTLPRPPREIDRSIPAELERIVMKCLSKKAVDRYSNAGDLAEDLRLWLAPEEFVGMKVESPIKILPKGLRSFDSSDSEYYLGLLPGSKDREGLPESVRFWKNRIEETDPSKTFRVGVIYGPSGCGKSSFVKAGLMPRLAGRLRVVYVEASPHGTEATLSRGLERACPDLPKNGSLSNAVSQLRRLGDSRRKVVFVIDQFEQWLNGDRNRENSELVDALRQCDGERVQCVILVRDDFWLALNRFMQSLEIKIVEGQNAALIDLFDLSHARKVLLEFGRAYGVLPDDGFLIPDQEEFLTRAVEGLAQDEKVISVRLALFAERIKGRPWITATLAEVGGAEGIGATFLDETFGDRSAPPSHRLHQEAARRVLRALLPVAGTDIKGHMLSQTELQLASGYGTKPKEFDDLMSILDNDLRLISPTDIANVIFDEVDDQNDRNSREIYFQLTHDFLVPSLRDWLTRKQKETKQGRAQLLLEDRSGVWNARPEQRQLPSLFEWIRIRRMISKKSWTAPQAKMMARAARFHGLRLATFAFIFVIATLIGLPFLNQYSEKRNRVQRAQSHLQRARLNFNIALEATSSEIKIKELDAVRDAIVAILGDGEVSGQRDEFDSLLSDINRSLGYSVRDKYDSRFMLLRNNDRYVIPELKNLIFEEQEFLLDLRKSYRRTSDIVALIEDTKVSIARESALCARHQNLARQYSEAMESLQSAENQLLINDNFEDNKLVREIEVVPTGLSRKIALALADIYHVRGETHGHLFRRDEVLKCCEKDLAIRIGFPVPESDPDYRTSQRKLAKSYGFLGDAHLQVASYARARENYIFAHAIRKNLAESEPEDKIEDKCMHARDFGNFAYLGLYSGDERQLLERISSLRDGVRYYEKHLSGSNAKILPLEYRFERISLRLDLAESLLNLDINPADSQRRLGEIDRLLSSIKAEFHEFAIPGVSFDQKTPVGSVADLPYVSPELLVYYTRVLIIESRNLISQNDFFQDREKEEKAVRLLLAADSIMSRMDLYGKANSLNYYFWSQIVSLRIQISKSVKQQEQLFVLLEERLRKSINLGFDIYHKLKRDRSFENIRHDMNFKDRLIALEDLLFEREKSKESMRTKVGGP